MTHEKNKVDIYYDNKLLVSLNADSPNLQSLIDEVLSMENLNESKFSCCSNINNFDEEGFIEIISSAIATIKEKLKTDVNEYNKALESVQYDDDAENYYKKLKE